MALSTNAAQAQYALPSSDIVKAIGELPIIDESGKSLPFKSLYTGDSAKTRTLIVFIRHFYCGLCEDYVRELTEHMPQSKLDGLTSPVKLVIIGCGALGPVAEYKKRTTCGFPIYCDPDRDLYSKLGMVENLSFGDKKPEYLKVGTWSMTLTSTYNALLGGRNAFKAGNYAQNGGELLFDHGELVWIHRMTNTRDHAEVSELKDVLKI